MIKYDRFWETLKKRHVSQYALYEKHGIDKKLLDRLRKMTMLKFLLWIVCVRFLTVSWKILPNMYQMKSKTKASHILTEPDPNF